MEKREYEKMFGLESGHWWFAGKRSVIFAFVNKYYRKGGSLRILDVGCGTGINMKFLQRYGIVYGVDVSDEALRFCRQRGLKNLGKASVMKLPFKDNSFDLVLCSDVLYHKNVDDVKAIREIFRVLKPGGRFFITDSAMKCLWSRHDLAVHAARRYSTREMGHKLGSAGFVVDKLSYMNFFLFPIVFVMRKISGLSKKQPSSDISFLPDPVNLVLKKIFCLESFFLKFVDFPFGVSLFAVARKPKNI